MFKQKILAQSLQYSFVISILALPWLPANAAVNIISQDFRKAGNTPTDIKWLMPYTAGGKFDNNTACLTMGATSLGANDAAKPTVAGFIPKCVSIAGDPSIVEDVNNGLGALRLTPAVEWRVGGIVSNDVMSTKDGVEITFTSYTYGSNSIAATDGSYTNDWQHKDGRGADGMSFYLLDGNAVAQIGATGGSLGYACSNGEYDKRGGSGVAAGYLAVGIDEYGNFISGGDVERTITVKDEFGNDVAIQVKGEGAGSYKGQQSDTASKAIAGMQPGTISLRGRGDVNLNYLIKNFGMDGWDAMGSGLLNGQDSINDNETAKQALLNACITGRVHNANTGANTGKRIANYDVLAYQTLDPNHPIGNIKARTRSAATPISYKIRITPSKLLSFWWSYNGGAYQPVLLNQNIEKLNGAMPDTIRFGFAGSTGGQDNIHEVTCFKAQPPNLSVGNSPSNTPDGKVIQGTQVFSGFYKSEQWTGNFTATSVLITSSGDLVANNKPNWDAACQYLGGTCSATGSGVNLLSSDKRVFWTNNAANQGMLLNWDNLSLDTQSKLNAGDNIGSQRLDYIKGVRVFEGQEVTGSNTIFRQREGILGDIIHSGAAVVGVPDKAAQYGQWQDKLYPNAILAEKSGETYAAFAAVANSRLNVAYIGANDGFLHGYRAGAYSSDGKTFIGNDANKPNDGGEILSFIPKSVLDRTRNTATSGLDLSNAQYAHNYYQDATPGTGDVFYNGKWHTWLVSGLGAGGNTIYGLDVTDPNFTNNNSDASAKVMGEWTYKSGDPLWQYLGNTYGKPQAIRLHNGKWGFVFGNGWCDNQDAANANCQKTDTGEAGIYLMMIQDNGKPVFKFLNTKSGTVANPNGIAETAPVDLDGDNITDYVYAGDLHGNVWRFDLTGDTDAAIDSANVAPKHIFTAQNNQPISTRVIPTVTKDGRVLLNFSTGKRELGYLTGADQYANSMQSMYGVWDGQMTEWNAKGSRILQSNADNSTLTIAQLTQQTMNTGSNELSQNDVCWAGTANCTGTAGKYGWYRDLRSKIVNGKTRYEQVVNNSATVSNILITSSYIDGDESIVSCEPMDPDGYLYGVDLATGKGIENLFASSAGAVALNKASYGDVVILWADGVPFVQWKDRFDNLGFEKLNLPVLPKIMRIKRLSWREIF